MTKPEWSQGGVNREQAIAELLTFIKDTAIIARQLAETDAFLKTPPAFGAVSMEDFKTELVEAAPTINSYLQLVGGIHASWIDPNNGERMQGIFQSFTGFDIDSGKWKLDFKGTNYSGPVSATPERLHEILATGQSDS